MIIIFVIVNRIFKKNFKNTGNKYIAKKKTKRELMRSITAIKINSKQKSGQVLYVNISTSKKKKTFSKRNFFFILFFYIFRYFFLWNPVYHYYFFAISPILMNEWILWYKWIFSTLLGTPPSYQARVMKKWAIPTGRSTSFKHKYWLPSCKITSGRFLFIHLFYQGRGTLLPAGVYVVSFTLKHTIRSPLSKGLNCVCAVKGK